MDNKLLIKYAFPGPQGAAGPQGPQGVAGPQGPQGNSLPAGGRMGDILQKISDLNTDAVWTSSGYIDPHSYGAKGDAVSLPNAVIAGDNATITHSQYVFSSKDIGKTVWIQGGWQDNGEFSTIASVSSGAATVSPAFTRNGTRYALVGTDDTAAIQAAFDAAEIIALTAAPTTNIGTGNGIPVAGCVRLRQGGYIVKNTQERYDAGKQAAIMVPRRCALIGVAQGSTAIYTAPGNVGHTIANKGVATLAADEKITLANFSIHGLRDIQGAQCGDAIHIAIGMGGYSQTDAYIQAFNINIHGSRGSGFYLKGRGECFFYNININYACQYGFDLQTTQDVRFVMCNAGGCYWSGFHVYDAASSEFAACKSYYNGSNGETDFEKTCNWYVGSANHSYLKGTCMFIGCEAQESRGSGWVIEGGLNEFIGCISSDPRRFGAAPFPSICAGLHIRGNGSNNVFDGFYIHAALGLDWGGSTEAHKGGDYAVYIEYNGSSNNKLKGPRGNKGHIYVLEPQVYGVSKLGGPGITNGLNTQLCIDGDPLPGDVPSAPEIATALMVDTAKAMLKITPPASLFGRNLRNYPVEYKLASDSTWTRVNMRTAMVNNYAILPGLVSGETYDIRVAAENIFGEGAMSPSVSYVHSLPTIPADVATLYVEATLPMAGTNPVIASFRHNSQVVNLMADMVLGLVGVTSSGLTNPVAMTSTKALLAGATFKAALRYDAAPTYSTKRQLCCNNLRLTPYTSARSVAFINTTTHHKVPFNANYTGVWVHFDNFTTNWNNGGEITTGMTSAVMKVSIQVGDVIYPASAKVSLAAGGSGYVDITGLSLTAGQDFYCHVRAELPGGTVGVPQNTASDMPMWDTGTVNTNDSAVDVTVSGVSQGAVVAATVVAGAISALTLTAGGTRFTASTPDVYAYEKQASGVVAFKKIGTAVTSGGVVTGLTLVDGVPPTGVSAWVSPTISVTNGAIYADGFGTGWGPTAITGIPDRPIRTVVGFGDPDMKGEFQNTTDLYGNKGIYEVGLASRCAFGNAGIGTGTAYMIVDPTKPFTRTIGAYAPYCTDAIVNYGYNDFVFSKTSAATITALQTLRTTLLAAGLRVNFSNILTRTTSTDNWATLANQTVVANISAFRAAVNSAISGGTIVSDDNIIDAAAMLVESDKNTVTGGIVTDDGHRPVDSIGAVNRNGIARASTNTAFKACFDYLAKTTAGWSISVNGENVVREYVADTFTSDATPVTVVNDGFNATSPSYLRSLVTYTTLKTDAEMKALST